MLKQASFLNLIVRISQIIIQLGLGIITNRILEAEGRGTFATLTSWQTLLFAVFYLSIPVAILNLFPAKIFSEHKFAGTALGTSLLLGFLGIAIGLLIKFSFPEWTHNLSSDLYWITLTGLPGLMFQAFILALFQIRGNFKEYNLLLLLPALLNVPLTLGFVFYGTYTVETAVYINLIYSLACAFTSFGLLQKLGISVLHFSFNLFRKLIQTGSSVHFSTIVVYAISRVDVILVNGLAGAQAAGIYFFSVMIVSALSNIPNALQSVMFYNYTHATPEERITRIKTACRLTFWGMILVSCLLALLMVPIVWVLGGNSFSSAVPLILIMLPGMCFWAIPIILASVWTQKGRFREVNILSLVQVIVLIGLNFLLIPEIGIYGAAITYTLVYLFGTILNIYFIHKVEPNITPQLMLGFGSDEWHLTQSRLLDIKGVILQKVNIFTKK